MTDQWARRKRKRRNRGNPPLGIPLVQDRVLNGLYRQTRRGLLLTVQMMTPHQLCLGHHRGVSACTDAPRFPSTAHTEHWVLSLPPDNRPNVPHPPERLTRDLAGKYGDPAVSQVILRGSNSADGQNPPPGDSTLGTLSQDRSPRSESICPVERPSSCDTGHNARLATKGSVQQSPVNRPVYSEHAPVTPGPGKPGNGLSTGTGTWYPVLGSTDHTG